MSSHLLSQSHDSFNDYFIKIPKKEIPFLCFYVVLLILDFQLAAKAARFPAFPVGDKAEALLLVGDAHLRLSYCSLPRLQEKILTELSRGENISFTATKHGIITAVF